MKKLEKAKISLDDCLACSGCVTSAETVLITQQSHEELRKVLGANKVSGGLSSDATLTQCPSLVLSGQLISWWYLSCVSWGLLALKC